MSERVPSMRGNIAMKLAKASASAKLLARLCPYAVRTRAGSVFWARSTSRWGRARMPRIFSVRLARRACLFGRRDHSLQEGAPGGADQRGPDLAQDAFDGARLLHRLLVDLHCHRR